MPDKVRKPVKSGPVEASRAFHVMTKPVGPLCNLNCTYCYYLEKEHLYPQSQDFKMSREVLERYIRQYIASQDTPELSFGWQGGEPTILGLDFFRMVVQLQEKHAGGRKVSNTIQTNGTLLNDEWCAFLAERDFLVGLSLDGPERLHDRHRVDKGGNPTFKKVMEGLELLKKHQVQFNTLTVVNRVNVREPMAVYRFLEETGSRHFQFIPLVERNPDPQATTLGLDLAVPPGPWSPGSHSAVTSWSVPAREYGEFLVTLFDHWVRKDVGEVFVQLFDQTLGKWVGVEKGLCVFNETCGEALALEHNGDLYSCDHYVYPAYLLGNIQEAPLGELARSPGQLAFGQAKKDTLPRYCLGCPVRFACNGECPKHRFIQTPDGETGLNYLCAAYRHFFTHVGPFMETMATLLRQRRPPAEIMSILETRELEEALRRAGRNDPCPCGSGRKFKSCCAIQRGR